MRFKAKSGVERELNLTDSTLSRIVKQCQDLPGQNLFQYLDDEGEPQPVSSTDVNDYIREAMGERFHRQAFPHLGRERDRLRADLRGRRAAGWACKAMLEPVAEALGNTPAISRKSYVHPALIEAVKDGEGQAARLAMPRATKYLSSAERGLIAFLGKAPPQETESAA